MTLQAAKATKEFGKIATTGGKFFKLGLRRGVKGLKIARETFNEVAGNYVESATKQALSVANEASAVLEKGNSFLRNSVSQGLNFASGLFGKAKDDAKKTAAANFKGGGRRRRRRQADGANNDAEAEGPVTSSTVDKAEEFFTSCIFQCGGGDTSNDGVPITLNVPLVLDLEADGISIIPQSESVVFFDMDVSGNLNSVSWIGADDAFLARDVNGNGNIDDASELFSSHTDSASRSGFEALAKFDTNSNGLVDALDADFGSLLVWQDLNGDGQSQEGELLPLADYNITALPTSKVLLPHVAPGGDVLYGGATVTTSSGSDDDGDAAPAPFLFELGLVTITDPVYIQGVDLEDGVVRQFFGRDASRLLVLTESVELDYAELKATSIFGSDEDDFIDGSGSSPIFVSCCPICIRNSQIYRYFSCSCFCFWFWLYSNKHDSDNDILFEKKTNTEGPRQLWQRYYYRRA